ncbi:RsiV family protein [uncultured Aquimarina sp.]|uniref:RsiV family protein n=1 Tax=uncultured Aquimarina sp. TaxID=575652 RepID=UPI0026207300|nr:RsiV family protein [uncultured Aquimarina sp.]
MRALIISVIIISLIACNRTQIKENPEKDTIDSEQLLDQNKDSSQYLSEENLELNQEKTKSIKVERLITIKDDKKKLQELVIAKKFYKEEDFYVLDYKYPYLNEQIDTNNTRFNDFLTENYLDIEATENEILEDKVIFCDSLGIGRCMDKRVMDYKIYAVKSNLLSVLLYKENYYSGMKHATYMFECLNFDLNNHKFIYYNDFFIENSEKELLTTINKIISDGINSGELFYECWELSEGDFKVYKNNFVVNDDVVEFYFDDCIICPSYTGTYSIEIPITEIMHLIRKYNNKPLIG